MAINYIKCDVTVTDTPFKVSVSTFLFYYIECYYF